MDLMLEDMDKILYEEVCNIINNNSLSTVFQPIISLKDCTILGYEALSRVSEKSYITSSEMLFEVADRFNKTLEIEELCLKNALGNARKNKLQGKLFLNINSKNLEDVNISNKLKEQFLESYLINIQNIIIEITERYLIKNIENFSNNIDKMKNNNFIFAMDDVGAGYSGLNLIAEVKPKYIKLDMKLIRNIDKDSTKQALVRGMYEFSKQSHSLIIAEGIETKDELSTLVEIGVHYGQGYLIQEPSAILSPAREDIINFVDMLNSKESNLYRSNLEKIHIKSLCKSNKTISSNMLVSKVDELLKHEPNLVEICVVENEFIKGIITRRSFYSKLGWQYGYSIYSSKPISAIMNTEFLYVDCNTPIHKVINLAMSRSQETLYDYITVTNKSKYYGVVTVKELIEKVMELEVQNAKYLNPLTELPGNIMIEENLNNCIQNYCNYSVLYFDIDNFKAYNDVYGFENGDKVIIILAKILRKNIKDGHFIGHIGGDDFIAVFLNWDVEEVCSKIINTFDKEVTGCYKREDLEKGYIMTANRHGVEEKFPIISLSIAAVTNKKKDYINIYELAEESSKLKKRCKQMVGSNYIIL
ncbi:GGDEF domain-containing protein [Inconstantimicrobium mannanitabidum]|uniref:GGDEF domain-containing protein n=1 Tax=Inconstantimicrobium mannanitabidum TaxID=1604901 RepID=UPI0021C38FBC|nr:GGDEF domain-containing protein [Clostridium sp. TW13]